MEDIWPKLADEDRFHWIEQILLRSVLGLFSELADISEGERNGTDDSLVTFINISEKGVRLKTVRESSSA